jgi:dTMP kinase
VTRTIKPALAESRWVVCDRFTDSTIAYQGYGHGLPLAELGALRGFALGDFRPDLTLILDLPVGEGLARAAHRPGAADRFERLDPAFHQRLRDGFLTIAKAEPQRCAIIDAAGDVENVHRAILAVVSGRLGVEFR